MSQAPYFWPNPATPDGLPYVRRDGERNPEIRRISDRDGLRDLISASETLALAYYLKGDRKTLWYSSGREARASPSGPTLIGGTRRRMQFQPRWWMIPGDREPTNHPGLSREEKDDNRRAPSLGAGS